MEHDRDRVPAGIRSWYERHGRPRSQVEWDAQALTQPSASTIARRFGRSSVAREALGDVERRAGRQASSWSRREITEAYDESGAWPSGRSWERAAARHPARRTGGRLFGEDGSVSLE
jgi:hypothetical protein